MHPDQLTIPLATVRRLVDAQFPRWRDLPISRFASQGTVNALFRVGEHLAARFPLQPGELGATRRWLEAEARAARELLGRTRFRTPEPVALGEPGEGYPLPWSVQTWLPGISATDQDPGGSVAFAHDLAEFITGVRAIDTGGRAFDGHGRGRRPASPRRLDGDLLRPQRATPGRPTAPPAVGGAAGAAAQRGRGRDGPR